MIAASPRGADHLDELRGQLAVELRACTAGEIGDGITISADQLEKLNLFGGNARPIAGKAETVACWPAASCPR